MHKILKYFDDDSAVNNTVSLVTHSNQHERRRNFFRTGPTNSPVNEGKIQRNLIICWACTDLHQNWAIGLTSPLLQSWPCAVGCFYHGRGCHPFSGVKIFSLKITPGMYILIYFKQLLFYTLFSESQYFSTYSQVKMSIF